MSDRKANVEGIVFRVFCSLFEEKKFVNFYVLLTVHLSIFISVFNLLTPNVNYTGRTPPLTSKVAFYIFVQQI